MYSDYVFSPQGLPEERIVLRPMTEPERSAPLPLLRLVDGPSVISGRLQVLHSGLWRDVCSNTRKLVQNLNLFWE